MKSRVQLQVAPAKSRVQLQPLPAGLTARGPYRGAGLRRGMGAAQMDAAIAYFDGLTFAFLIVGLKC